MKNSKLHKRQDMSKVKKNFEKLPIDVLFVEDEEMMRDSIAEIMRRRVNNVLVAGNGHIGLEMYKKHHPHVIITDIRMPIMTGLEMLEKIREFDENIKVIVVSAHNDVQYFQQAINLGVDGFLLKPINVNNVIKQISKITRQLVYKQKALEFEDKIQKFNELIFQNKTRASAMQISMAPSWLLPEKKLLFSSNYIVDESTPSGDFFDIIPISETRYIAYMGHFPHQDIKGTLFMLTIKITMDTIIKNELEMASPGVILDRLVKILGSDNLTDSMELLVCLIDSDFEFVRYAKIGSVNILQYDLETKTFCDLSKSQNQLNSESSDELEKPMSTFEELEFSFDEQKLNFLYSCELQNYQLNEKKLGLDGIKQMISDIEDPNFFLIPYIFREKLIKDGYQSLTSDFSFVLFRTNNLIKSVDNRFLVTFKSVLTNTAHIRRQCEKFVLEKTGLDDLAFEVELVIAEILTNVIVHGLKNKPDTMVVLSLEITDNVIISIWDKGIEWIIPAIKKEDAFDLVANDATSGRGLPIIVTLSDEIARKRIDSINQTQIIFTIDSDKESLC